MTDGSATGDPLETVTEVIDDQILTSFKTLGNEIRLAVLLALWEARDPGPPTHDVFTDGLSYTELRNRVGTPDSGKFNYHIDKLVGTFIKDGDEGYALTAAAERILSAIFAGSLGDYQAFEGEPIDTTCQQCGGESVVIDYAENWLTKRCTDCPGQYELPDMPGGILAYLFRPPAGLVNRSPREFHRAGNIWTRNRLRSMYEGVCPDCTGKISCEISVCQNHESREGTICNHCGSVFEIQPYYVCEVCKFVGTGPWHSPSLSDSAVMTFFINHGLYPHELYIEDSQDVLHNTVEDVDLVAEDPVRIRVTYELDGDRLDVTLDEETRVIEVSER